ncbi:D-alanyl-D-alanine carboxypeptidase [Kitasatospora sp. NBC_01287]|uniref:D-alanyl-D-alanine carboxypeptidase family protein n=1 Tax=Kitasatospora sp. NBC_01287 TaxID=2903573 RepID=UPI0022500783|nr:D-alanyl-D-alanine carboxypeptidase [Kitasatospora sp. NBC_01287]MCX4748584.1 D-alanyl-D-alanine carboxypeptidase [Kitasatospora sp. NBC_01287]
MCRTARRAAALAAALLLATAPVAAAEPPPVATAVGGERLGLPGVQVALAPGAPRPPEGLTGMSWLVADADSGAVLAAFNPHLRLPPASTLKMLFADTVLPKFDRKAVHRVAPEELAGLGAGSSLVGVKEDLDYRVEDLWRGVFLSSGNDAVHVLAHMNGGVEQTVGQMQQKAVELGAADTHVVSPDGYDEDGQLTSAYDLTLFAREGLRNPDFRSYCGTKDAQFPGAVDSRTGQRGTFGIQNTDRLLGKYPGLIGVKNGYTTNAGSTFVGAAQRDGRTLLVAVMHPETYMKVYDETAALLDWGFAVGGRLTPVGRLVSATPAAGAAAAAAAAPAAGPQGAAPAPLPGLAVPRAPAPAAAHGLLAGPPRHRAKVLSPEGWTVVAVVTLCATAAGWVLNRRRRGPHPAAAAATGTAGPDGSGGASASRVGRGAIVPRLRRRRPPRT